MKIVAAVVVVALAAMVGVVTVQLVRPAAAASLKLPESSNGSAKGHSSEAPSAQKNRSPSAESVAAMAPKVSGAATSGRPDGTEVFTPSTVATAPEAVATSSTAQAPAPPAATASPSGVAGRVEVPSGDTANSTEYANPDGTFTTAVSAEPVHFHKSDGSWGDIDLRLASDGKGRHRQVGSGTPVDAADTGNDPALGNVDLGGGRGLSFGLAGAAKVAASDSSTTATYANVLPNTDLTLTPIASGLKEDIVLKSAAAPTSFRFPLTLRGLTASVDAKSGSVLLADASGTVQAVIPHGWMEDSSIGQQSRLGNISDHVSYSLVTVAGGGQALQVDLDASWLQDPSRVFPVTVDPTTQSVTAGADDTYLDSVYSGTHSAETEMHVGTYNGGTNLDAAYIHFPFPPLWNNDTVVGVSMSLWNFYSWSCTPAPVNVYQVTQAWDGTTMGSWPGAAYGNLVASGNFANGYSSSCPANWNTFSDTRLTNLVNAWTHKPSSNQGLTVRAGSNTSNFGWKFYASENAGTGSAPVLSVTWTPYGATYAPSGTWTAPTNTTAGKMTVRVTNTGRDTWPANSAYRLSYHVYDSTDTTELVHQGAQTMLPTPVAPGQYIDLPATVNPLAPGGYHLRWDMEQSGVSWFQDQGINPGDSGVNVLNVSPVVDSVSPSNGSAVSSLTPTLRLTGTDPDRWPNAAVNYSFELCTGTDANSGSCWSSGWIAPGSWSPPAGALGWNQTYYWRGQVGDGLTASAWSAPIRIQTQVASSTLGSHFGADGYSPSVADVNPIVGNYTSSQTDAVEAGVGPALNVTRTYNSRDTSNGMFGTGWSTPYDMSAAPIPTGSGAIGVRYADGRQANFGRNADNSYFSPVGYYSTLTAPAAVADSFTRPNSATSMGTTDTGQTWAGMSGSGYWGISGNQAYLATAGAGNNNAVYVAAPSDGTVAFSEPTAQDHLGVLFRGQDPSNFWMLYATPGSTAWTLAKRVAGTNTVVATSAAGTCCTASDAMAVMFNGPAITVERNGRAIITASDTAFQTATFAGLYAQTTGSGRIGPVTITADGHRDTFTRANSTTSTGQTDDGETWVGIAGGWGISANQVYLATAAGAGAHNLLRINGAADGTDTFSEPVAQAGVGLAFRIADSANYWRLVAQPGSSAWQLVKRVGGVDTTVATSAAGTCCTASDVLTVTTAGRGITVSRNGTAILSVSDPAGMFGSGVGPYADTSGAGRVDTITATAATTLTEKTGTHYTFRSDGKLISVTDILGRASTLAYDANANLATVTNSVSGRKVLFTSSGGHTATVSTDAVGGSPLVWHYGYTGNSLTSVTSPRSSTPTGYEYTAGGLLSQIDLPAGNIGVKIGYNGDGTVAWRQDGLGDRTTYTATTSGSQITVHVVDPDGDAADWVYDGARLISHTDGGGTRTFTYNAAGFLTQVTDENGNSVVMSTDAHGNILTRSSILAYFGSSPLLFTSYYTYFSGAPGDPRNDEVLTARDARSASASDTTYLTSYTYDTAGNLTGTTTPPTADFLAGRTATWSYATGSEAAYGGGTVPPGVLLSTTDPAGKSTGYTYDAKGDLRGDADPVGLTHTYTYDALGRRTAATQTSSAFPLGLTTSYTYDGLSQPLTTTEPGVTNPITGVTHTKVTSDGYDLNDNLTAVAVSDATGGDATRLTTTAYDGDNRPLSTTVAAGSSVPLTHSQTYTPGGDIATRTDPNGTVTAYTYTTRHQLATTTVKNFVDDPVAGSTPRDVMVESRAYDPAGRLASVTDALGRTTTRSYYLNDLPETDTLTGYRPPVPATGSLSTGTAYDIKLTDRGYDGAGNQTITVTGNGSTTSTATFDATSEVTSATLDPAGLNRTQTVHYDADSRPIAQIASAAGTSITEETDTGYDADGRIITQTVQGDGTTSFTSTIGRDSRGFVTAVTDPRGYTGGAPNPAYTASATTDAAGRPATVTSAPVAVEQNGGSATTTSPTSAVGYDTFGEVTGTKDGRGLVTTTTYDAAGRRTGVAYPSYTPPGGTASTPSEAWTYDADGNALTHVDRRGQTTTTVYDKRGRPVAVTDPQLVGAPAAGVTRYTYDDAGNTRSVTDQNGDATWYAYDDLDRVWAKTAVERNGGSPVGFNTYYDHDAAGHLTSTTSPNNGPTGPAVTATYDPAGKVTSVSDETGATTTIAYDVTGQPASITDPDGRTTSYTYDRAGRQTVTKHYDHTGTLLTTTTVGYDAAGNPTSATNPNGATTTVAYDAANQLRSLVQPLTASASATTTVGYDADGNHTRLTDANGHTTVTTYNSQNLPESVILPSTTAQPNPVDRTTTTAYDNGGLPTVVTQPGNVVTSASYDTLGRLTSQTGTGAAAATATRTLGYDLTGRMTSLSTPTGTDTLTYNDRGLITASAGPAGTASFGYDADGQPTSRVDRVGTTTYTYDTREHLASLTNPGTGVTQTRSYDPAGQLTTIAYGAGGPTRSYGYDDLGRQTSDTVTAASGTAIRTATYGYDADGNRTSSTLAGTGIAGTGSNTYGYDKADRLVSWTNPSSATTAYGYDPVGNRTSVNATTATFDERNRILTSGSTTYSYTARGTRTTTTGGGTTTTDAYDAFNRLVTSTTGSATTSYGYDSLDRLATYNGFGLSYDGAEKENVYDGTAGYVRTPTGDLAGIATSSGSTEAITDPHTDVVATLNPASGGTITSSTTYDPFGTVTATAGTRPGSLGYQSALTDPATGNVNMQSRWYTPATGSFTSADTWRLPLTSAASTNSYLYGNANPLTGIDPTGHFEIGGYELRPPHIKIPGIELPKYLSGIIDDAAAGFEVSTGVAVACDAATLLLCIVIDPEIIEGGTVLGAIAGIACDLYCHIHHSHGSPAPTDHNRPSWRFPRFPTIHRLSLPAPGTDSGPGQGQGPQLYDYSNNDYAYANSTAAPPTPPWYQSPVATTPAPTNTNWHKGQPTGPKTKVHTGTPLHTPIGPSFVGPDCTTTCATTNPDTTDATLSGPGTCNPDTPSSSLDDTCTVTTATSGAGGRKPPRNPPTATGAAEPSNPDDEATNGTTLFRGMRGASDGSPELGSTAKTLGARPGIDIPVDEAGVVRPGTGGMSVNDSPTGMPEYRRPPSFEGSGKDLNMYCISSCDIGPGLRYAPDAGGHGFLEPAWEMPFSEYQGYLQGTVGSWTEVRP